MLFDFGGFTRKKVQFKMYALFLLADGQWRQEEENLLNTISKEMSLDTDIKKETITYCQSLGITTGDHSDMVIQEIDRALSVGGPFFTLHHNTCVQAETIWTLINLGYADQDYSAAEKKVVQHLVDKWEIKQEMISEFVDTAETILLLTKQIEWLKSVGLSYEETKRRLETVEQQIQLMFDNIQATISEADAV